LRGWQGLAQLAPWEVCQWRTAAEALRAREVRVTWVVTGTPTYTFGVWAFLKE